MLKIIFLVFMGAGVPVAIAMAGASLVYILITGNLPPFVVIHRMVSGIDSFPLLAVPFFILAGNLMNNAGITKRIYNFALALVGWLKGGLGHVNVLGSVIFAGMSGTAIADAAGLGTIEIKAMKEHGYSTEFAVGVTAASARRVVDETGCQAVKLEGGVDMARQIAAIVAAGIAVMGHIGLLPQSVEKDGGYKIKGRTEENVAALVRDALAVEEAGAFSVVIEGTVETVAADITHRIAIPTIGIGASRDCDGQILVIDDMVGLTVDRVPKFVKEYADLRSAISHAAASYASEVRSRTFPGSGHVFSAKDRRDDA